jgi:bifunctional ADP-heptose synthase (sugar kinase/adenylyltransferase)
VKRTVDIDDSMKYGIAQSMLGQNQTTKTITKTTRVASDGQQQISIRRDQNEKDMSELDEKYLQSRVRITRRYQGKTKSDCCCECAEIFFHRKYSH